MDYLWCQAPMVRLLVDDMYIPLVNPFGHLCRGKRLLLHHLLWSGQVFSRCGLMSSSHRYHSASGPKVSPKCIQIHNNARRILIQCFDHRSHICCPVASPLRLSMDRCCWRCSLWPMGYRVCSRLLVLFSYSVEVLGGLCLFVYFELNLTFLMRHVCDRTMAGSKKNCKCHQEPMLEQYAWQKKYRGWNDS